MPTNQTSSTPYEASQVDGALAVTGPIHTESDYTFYLPGNHKVLCERRKLSGTKNAYNEDCQTKVCDKDDQNVFVEGRALICSCFAGERFSVNIRHDSHPTHSSEYRKETTFASSWAPDRNLSKGACSIENICDLLYKCVFSRERKMAQGLVLVTGATKSAKSKVARGLVHQYLEDQVTDKSRDRRPHLVTFEDPIEVRFLDPPLVSEFGEYSAVDYTPRQQHQDATTLGGAVNDALRQTPTVFYIGEIRSDDDWRHAMHLAGTGHLVVSTAHAGSLVEAMRRLFAALEAKTPAERGEYAERLLAGIHQRPYPIAEKIAVIPSLWRHTNAGVAALVSDGLSSILPNNPDEPDSRMSSLGRSWFGRQLLKDKVETIARQLLSDDLAGI